MNLTHWRLVHFLASSRNRRKGRRVREEMHPVLLRQLIRSSKALDHVTNPGLSRPPLPNPFGHRAHSRKVVANGTTSQATRKQAKSEFLNELVTETPPANG